MSFASVFDFSTNLAKLKLFFIFSFLWTLLFLIINYTVYPERKYKNLSKKSADDIRNRIISIIHGLTSFILTLYHLIAERPEYGMNISDTQHFIIIFSSSYFFYDSLACGYYGLVDFALVLHHGLVIFGYFCDEFYGLGGTETLCKSIFLLIFIFILIYKVKLA